MTPLISIRTLYLADSTLFDNILLPEKPDWWDDDPESDTFNGYWININKDRVVERILMEFSELNCYYSSPLFMKAAINTWSNIENIKWQRMNEALSTSYKPLENYDKKGKIVVTRNLENNTDNHFHSQNEVINKGVGYNSGELVINSEVDTQTYSPNDIGGVAANRAHSADTGTLTTEDTTHGNIGVTTSQQMLLSELEIAAVTVYDKIIESFRNEFIVEVY